jgi:tetratricopeptide (TPR) repeat protein
LQQAGRLDEALEHLEQAREIGIVSGVSRAFGPDIYSILCDIHIERGDFDAARATVKDGLELARAIESTRGEALMLACDAEAEIGSGSGTGSEGFADRVEASLDAATQLAANLENRRVEPRILRVRAELARARGDESTYVDHLREAAALYRAVGQSFAASRLEKQLAGPRS